MKVKKNYKKSLTRRKTKSEEPMVKVLQVNVNPDNPKNGFFELDWNDEFVNMLKQNGYTGESEEEIVDRWFKVYVKLLAMSKV
jgi:predicted Ser/Thr protein kinase